MSTLLLVRHGQSLWNLENRFTGWWDVDLSAAGEEEARQAGRLLADEGLLADVAHTSLLTRAIRTLNILQEETGRLWIPVYRHWRLNERHYGGLTGLDKAETRDRYGDEQFRLWRRSYDVPPPPTGPGQPLDVSADPRYVPGVVPRTECLADVVVRMLPYWFDAIAPHAARRQGRARGRPRQQPAGAHQAPRPDERGRRRQAGNPDRRPDRLRTGQGAPAPPARWALAGRPGRHRRRHRGRSPAGPASLR